MLKTEKFHERVLWIDTLKGLCMTAVLVSHAYPPTAWIRFFTPFFLTGFFFASGYTFHMRASFHDFLMQKVRSLLIPLISLSLINGVVGALFKGVPFRERLLGIVIQQAGGYESLWFFACLFVCELLFYVVVRLAGKEWHLMLITHTVSALGFAWIAWGGVSLPWQFDIACVSLMFLSWGFVYRRHEKKIDAVLLKWSVFIAILIVYTVLCFVYDNDVNVHDRRFGVQGLFTLEALMGMTFIVGIAKKINSNRILGYIGSHSIVFFSFQGFLLQTLRRLIMKFSGMQNQVVLCLGSVAVALPILGIAAHVMYEYFPFLLGRPRKHGDTWTRSTGAH